MNGWWTCIITTLPSVSQGGCGSHLVPTIDPGLTESSRSSHCCNTFRVLSHELSTLPTRLTFHFQDRTNLSSHRKFCDTHAKYAARVWLHHVPKGRKRRTTRCRAKPWSLVEKTQESTKKSGNARNKARSPKQSQIRRRKHATLQLLPFVRGPDVCVNWMAFVLR